MYTVTFKHSEVNEGQEGWTENAGLEDGGPNGGGRKYKTGNDRSISELVNRKLENDGPKSKGGK